MALQMTRVRQRWKSLDTVTGGVSRTQDNEQEAQEEGASAEEEAAQQGGEHGRALEGQALPAMQLAMATRRLMRASRMAMWAQEVTKRVLEMTLATLAAVSCLGQHPDAVLPQHREDAEVTVHSYGGQTPRSHR